MSETPKALLQVKNLSIGIHKGKRLYKSVEDISFTIYPGEILGIVGESGSGKSLSALSIAGLLGEGKEVTSGSMLYSGGEYADGLSFDGPSGAAEKDLLALSEKEMETIRGKEISMIFQEPFSSLNPLKKAGVQIAETLELHGKMEKAKRKQEVLELLKKLKFPDPEKIADAYPHRLSGGMCQRVMIALAVICRPRLLIADEPTTALDQDTQSQIVSLLKDINRDFYTSILFISHDISLIRQLCGRVLVMYSGRILEEGNTEDIFSHPAHEYTKGLLNSIPFRGHRGKDLATIKGRVPSLEEGAPTGCPFHPRCEKAEARCRAEFPPEKLISAGHLSHCVLDGGA